MVKFINFQPRIKFQFSLFGKICNAKAVFCVHLQQMDINGVENHLWVFTSANFGKYTSISMASVENLDHFFGIDSSFHLILLKNIFRKIPY